MNRDVVITGLGVVTRDAIGRTHFERWLGQGGGLPSAPKTFDAARFRAQGAYMVDPEDARQALARLVDSGDSIFEPARGDIIAELSLDCAVYGFLAALEAVQSAKLGAEHRQKTGLSLATTSGGAMDPFAAASAQGEIPAASIVRNMRPASAAAAIAETLGLGGAFANFSCACVSSAMAIAFAYERVRAGDAPLMIAGGCDQAREADYAGFNSLRAMDRESCRPFDVSRRGMVMGDGSAVLVLEDAEHARARGVSPLAGLLGVGLAADAHHITAPAPEGMTRAMRQALAEAGAHADDITYVNCHGTGTAANDEAEIEALSAVFDDPKARPVISSTKGATGHLLGTAAALEAAAVVLALDAGAAPPMCSTTKPMDCGFPIPGPDHPMPLKPGLAMSNSLGFGGLNASLIFSHASDHAAGSSGLPAATIERRAS